MQSETLESLPNSKNEWLRIFLEGENLEEMLMATYSRAMANDVFRNYAPRNEPCQPDGWFEDYQDFMQIKNKDDRSEAWKIMKEKYKGYLAAKESVENANASDFLFLKDMRDFFEDRNVFNHKETCELRMREFILFLSKDFRKMLGL